MAPALHQLLARLFQFGAEGRVGDCDKHTGSFGQGAPAQVGNAMFGDHEVGLGARRRDDPVGQLGDDARTGAFAIGRLQRDDRTPLRERDLAELLSAVRFRERNSQLLSLSDAAYEAGLRRIERDLDNPQRHKVRSDNLCFVTVRGDRR